MSDNQIILSIDIEDPIEFLSAIKSLLRESAAISFPSLHWFRTPLRKIRYKLRNCPVYFYNEQQITAILKTSGFSSFEINKIPGAGMDYHVIVYP